MQKRRGRGWTDRPVGQFVMWAPARGEETSTADHRSDQQILASRAREGSPGGACTVGIDGQAKARPPGQSLQKTPHTVSGCRGSPLFSQKPKIKKRGSRARETSPLSGCTGRTDGEAQARRPSSSPQTLAHGKGKVVVDPPDFRPPYFGILGLDHLNEVFSDGSTI